VYIPEDTDPLLKTLLSKIPNDMHNFSDVLDQICDGKFVRYLNKICRMNLIGDPSMASKDLIKYTNIVFAADKFCFRTDESQEFDICPPKARVHRPAFQTYP
jgi:hypothetical protein